MVAIIGPKTSAAVKAIYPVCSKFNIPLISASATDPSLVYKNNEYLLRMSPPDTKMSDALVDLIEEYKWNRMGILTSDTDYGKKISLRMSILILLCITVAWERKESMRFPVCVFFNRRLHVVESLLTKFVTSNSLSDTYTLWILC